MCGTVNGYRYHHRHGETPCEACKEAMRPYWAEVDHRRRVRRKDLEAPCGTPSAYRRHLRRGEPIDAPCRAAATAELAEYRRRKRLKRLRGSWRLVIIDYLETHGAMAENHLFDMIAARHDDARRDTVHRVLMKLVTDGEVESIREYTPARYALVDD